MTAEDCSKKPSAFASFGRGFDRALADVRCHMGCFGLAFHGFEKPQSLTVDFEFFRPANFLSPGEKECANSWGWYSGVGGWGDIFMESLLAVSFFWSIG